MTPTVRGILITVAVAFVAGLGGVWAGKLIFDPATPNMHEVIHRDLGLAPDQVRRIEVLEHEFAGKRQALELEMRAANAELATALREEQGYGPRVTAAVQRFHHAMGELQNETLRHLFAMREVMTPDQRVRFDNIVAGALVAEQH